MQPLTEISREQALIEQHNKALRVLVDAEVKERVLAAVPPHKVLGHEKNEETGEVKAVRAQDMLEDQKSTVVAARLRYDAVKIMLDESRTERAK